MSENTDGSSSGPAPTSSYVKSQPHTSIFKNKWVLIALAVVVLAAAVAAALWYWPKSPFVRLGVDLAHAEGTVEYRSSSDGEWQTAPSDLSLSTGAQVRTGNKSRAILNIDDGSAVRLNANSTVAFVELSPSHIVVENINGDVYTRVVKSETRVFEVKTGDATYQSEGTGYRTVNTDKKDGVEVYHSKVKVLGVNDEGEILVEQGEQYYLVNLDKKNLEGKVTKLSAEDIAKDSFMKWNSEEDKKQFSDELGVLFDLSAPKLEISSPANGATTESESIEVKGKTEEGAKVTINGKAATNNKGSFSGGVALAVGANTIKVEAVDGAGNKTRKSITVTRNQVDNPDDDIVFWLTGKQVDNGVYLSWAIKNVTLGKGFKLIKSKTNAYPTYPGDDGTFVESSTRAYTWGVKDGKTYYFRVCVYTDSGCSRYSNVVQVTAPTFAEETPTGTLTLSHTGGNDVSWVLSGYAPYGFKLVWSNSSNPTYPGSSAQYYDKTATTGSITTEPGTYYVRICMYKSGGCVNYSNQVTITLP